MQQFMIRREDGRHYKCKAYPNRNIDGRVCQRCEYHKGHATENVIYCAMPLEEFYDLLDARREMNNRRYHEKYAKNMSKEAKHVVENYQEERAARVARRDWKMEQDMLKRAKQYERKDEERSSNKIQHQYDYWCDVRNELREAEERRDEVSAAYERGEATWEQVQTARLKLYQARKKWAELGSPMLKKKFNEEYRTQYFDTK